MQGSWPHTPSVRLDPTSPPSDDGSAGESFSGSDGREIDMNSAGRPDDKPSPQSDASSGGDLSFNVKLQSGARTWPPRLVHMPSAPFPTLSQVLFQAARVEAFAAVKLCDRVLSPDASLADAVAQCGVSGPIPLEFTFNETVKECTCIGCDNFLVKRSSRRACDICQARGHTLSNRRVLRLLVPHGVPIRDSPSGIVKYPKTPANIDATDPSVVLNWLNTFAHWKFEGTPQDFAALDIASQPTVAATAAGPIRVKSERVPALGSAHAQIFVVFKEESMVDEVMAEAQRLGIPAIEDSVAPHALAVSRLPEDANLRCRLRMISHYWKLEVRALLPSRRFKDFVFSKLGKQSGSKASKTTSHSASAVAVKRAAPSVSSRPPPSPRTTSSVPLNLNVGGYSLSYHVPMSLPLPLSAAAPAVHAPLSEAQPAVMPVSMAVQLAPVPGMPNQFTLVPAVQQHAQLQFAPAQSTSAAADAPAFSVSVAPAPTPATSGELITYLAQSSHPQQSLSFDHFNALTGNVSSPPAQAGPVSAPSTGSAAMAEGRGHAASYHGGEQQFHAPQTMAEQQQQQHQIQQQQQQQIQQQQQQQMLHHMQHQMQQQQMPPQQQLQLPPSQPHLESLAQPFSGALCDSSLMGTQRPLPHSLSSLAEHNKLPFAAPACEPDHVSDLSPPSFSSQLHHDSQASVVVAHSTPSSAPAPAPRYGPSSSSVHSNPTHPAGSVGLREEHMRVSNQMFNSLSRCSDLVVKGLLTPEQASDLASAEQRVLMQPEAASMPVLFVFRDLRPAAREAQAQAANGVHSGPRRRRQRSHSPPRHTHGFSGHYEGSDAHGVDEYAQSAQKRGRTTGDGWPASMAVGDVLSDSQSLSSESSDPSDRHAHGTLFNEMLGDLRHGLQDAASSRPPPPPLTTNPHKRSGTRRARVVVNHVTQQLNAVELEVKRGKVKRPEGVSSEALDSAMRQHRWYRLNKFAWNPWLLAIEALLAVAAITLLFNAVLLNQSHDELNQPSIATDTPAPVEHEETWNIMAPFNNPVRLHTQLTSVEADSRDILKAMSGVSWLFSNFLTVFNVSVDTIPFRYVTSRVNLLQRAVDAISVANAMANVVEDFSDNYQLLNSSTSFQSWADSKCIILQNTLSQAVLYNLCGRSVLQMRPYPYPFDSMDNFTADSSTCRSFRMNLANFYDSVHDQLQDAAPHTERLDSLHTALPPQDEPADDDMDPITPSDQSFAGLPSTPNAFDPDQRHPSARFRVSRYSSLSQELDSPNTLDSLDSAAPFEWDVEPAVPASPGGNRFRSLRDLTPSSQISPNSNNLMLPVDSTGIFNDTTSCSNAMAYLLKFFMYQKWDDQNFKADPSLWQFRMRSSADQLRTQAAVLHVPVSMLGNLNRNAPTSIFVQSRDWQLRGYALFILSFGAQGLHILLLFLLYGIYYAYKWCTTSKIVMLPLAAQRPGFHPAVAPPSAPTPFVGPSVHFKSAGPLPTIAEKAPPPTGLENVTVVGEPDGASASMQETEMSEL